MIALLATWPASVWVVLIPLLGASLAWPANRLWALYVKTGDRSERREDRLEDMVDLLRRALDKGRIRENGLVTGFELLLLSLDVLEDPHPAIVSAKQRACEILMRAMLHAKNVGDGLKP